jgi:hypothetical protein
MPSGLSKEKKETNPPKPKRVTPVEQFSMDISKNINDKTNFEEEIKLEDSDSSSINEQQTEEVKAEQVQAQTVTIIQSQNQEPKVKGNEEKNIVEVKEYSQLEQYYLNRLEEIRHKIDNPTPIDRLNKRRKYSADTRRNVTFSIREDLAWLIDDIVDDAKIFKGLFHDEVLDMGIRAFIKKYGLKNKDPK